MTPQIWPKPFNYYGNVKLFLISLCVILSLLVMVVAWLLHDRNEKLLLQRVKEQAMAYADLIEHVKMWNYDYGGVYVEKNKGVKSNSYLRKTGINPDIHTTDGRTLTLRNHAIMAKEISVRSQDQDGAAFRIVSAHPLDPSNIPDTLEIEGLRQFERGQQEFSQMVLTHNEEPLFRYVLPLRAEQSCLECHRIKVGEVLGALSITISISELVRQTQTSQLLIVLTALLIIGLIVSITYFLTWRLVISLDEAQHRLKRLASTDELTGLRNRRYMMKRLEEEYERSLRLGQELCVIMLDLDYFKKINDTWGHPFGDEVLKWVSNLMNEVVRTYDIIGRIGGEEFLIISPSTTLEEAVILAERLRKTVEQETLAADGNELTITISAGVALQYKAHGDSADLIRRADAALYRAKHAGRNRVEADY